MMMADEVIQRSKIIFYKHLCCIWPTICQMGYNKLPSVVLDDLKQVGRIALWEAALKFDSAEGCKFWTYAQHCVQGAIRKTIRDGSGPINVTEYAYRSGGQRFHYFSIEPYDEDSGITLPEEIQLQLCIDERDSIHTSLDLQKALDGLSKEERKLVEQLFGFEGPDFTIAEIAQLEGKSRAAIYKKKEKVLAKMRKSMKSMKN